jgi:hypothetical protein
MKVLNKSDVMKVLKKKIHRRQQLRARASRSAELVPIASSNDATSSSSVNNDWQNWVALQGKNQVVLDDVQEMGRVIGASFLEHSQNKFDVLSRPKRATLESVVVLEKEQLGTEEGGE